MALRLPATVLSLALAVAACASDAPTSSTATGQFATNYANRIVELDNIVLDTFGAGPVTLAEADDELIRGLRDAIPPIDEPVYEPAVDADWLGPGDRVQGYVGVNGTALAYPTRILDLHELVNDDIDGEPVLISWCPLCRSGVVFERRLDGEPVTFGNTSALFDNDLVMVDRATGTWWWQVAGRGLVGDHAGTELDVLPSSIATWGDWVAQHPESLVLSQNLGSGRDYGPRAGQQLEPFPSRSSFWFAWVAAFPDTEICSGE